MKYEVRTSNYCKQIEAKTPQDAIISTIGNGIKESLKIDRVSKANINYVKPNCSVCLIEGNRKTQNFYHITECVLYATISRLEHDYAIYVYDYKSFVNQAELQHWFEIKCKSYRVVMDDTVTILLVRLSSSQLKMLQMLEEKEDFDEMVKIVNSLDCVDVYTI
jgi:hypothetical protein